MKKALRGPGTYLLLLLLVFFLVSSLGGTPTVDKEVGYSEFMQLVENNEISSIYVMENEVKALKRSTTIQKEDFPKQYDVSTYLPSIDVFMKDVQSILGPNPADKDVSLQFVAEPEPSWLLTMLPYLLTMLLMGGLFYFMISQQGGQGGPPPARIPGLRYIPIPAFSTISFGAVYRKDSRNATLRLFLSSLGSLMQSAFSQAPQV